jgi:hypothetical protein
MPFPPELRDFVNRETWTYAKTMPEWPHERNPLTWHQENGSSLDTSLPPSRATASPHRARTTLGVRPRLAGPAVRRTTPDAVSIVAWGVSASVSRRGLLDCPSAG